MILKVCGITRQQDADLLRSLSVDMCGFIFHPRSPRAVLPETAALLRTGPLLRAGVFVRQNVTEIRRIMDVASLDYAQFHGMQSPACASALGPERVIRVLWPERYSNPAAFQQEIDLWASYCAFFLVDSGLAGGGSGALCTASVLSRVVFPRPWLLAGGLTPGNAPAALRRFSPGGLDFNSGLEDRPGIKNAALLQAAARLRAVPPAARGSAPGPPAARGSAP